MDKVILKVTGIISIVIGTLYSLTIIGAIVGIPLIIGGFKFITYSNMTDERIVSEKSNILGWSIFFLFFTFFGGVLGLFYYFSLTEIGNKVSDSLSAKRTNMNYLEELEKLKELCDKEVITKEEYEERKKQILKTK